MQGIEHINFTNSPSFAANPGALIAKSVEIYYKLNADEVEIFDKVGLIPERLAKPAEDQGFDLFALATAVRVVHAKY